MNARAALRRLFGAILVAMLLVTGCASLAQPVWQCGGLVNQPDRAWTIAALADAYAGFLTFYAWVCYQERAPGRVGWFVFIMLFGDIAMSLYVPRELGRLPSGGPPSRLLTRTAP